MKIKCPACQAVLNIPESAAGKVVKCPCGKQLRAPGVSSQPVAGSANPAGRPGPAAGAPTQQPRRPAARRPAASGRSDFDPGMLDELTDQDLRPVTAVQRPGHAKPQAGPSVTSGKLYQQYAPTGSQGINPANMQIASVGARIGGKLIDGLFISIGYGLFFAAFMVGVTASGEAEEPPPIFFIALAIGGVLALIPFIINIVLISKSGQTVGKKAVGTRMVLEATGQPATFVHGFLIRGFVFNLLAQFVPFLALIDIFFLFSEKARTLHDRLAGTVVINAS